MRHIGAVSHRVQFPKHCKSALQAASHTPLSITENTRTGQSGWRKTPRRRRHPSHRCGRRPRCPKWRAAPALSSAGRRPPPPDPLMRWGSPSSPCCPGRTPGGFSGHSVRR